MGTEQTPGVRDTQVQNQRDLLADWGQGEMKGDKAHSQLPDLVAMAVPFSGVSGEACWGNLLCSVLSLKSLLEALATFPLKNKNSLQQLPTQGDLLPPHSLLLQHVLPVLCWHLSSLRLSTIPG